MSVLFTYTATCIAVLTISITFLLNVIQLVYNIIWPNRKGLTVKFPIYYLTVINLTLLTGLGFLIYEPWDISIAIGIFFMNISTIESLILIGHYCYHHINLWYALIGDPDTKIKSKLFKFVTITIGLAIINMIITYILAFIYDLQFYLMFTEVGLIITIFLIITVQCYYVYKIFIFSRSTERSIIYCKPNAELTSKNISSPKDGSTKIDVSSPKDGSTKIDVSSPKDGSTKIDVSQPKTASTKIDVSSPKGRSTPKITKLKSLRVLTNNNTSLYSRMKKYALYMSTILFGVIILFIEHVHITIDYIMANPNAKLSDLSKTNIYDNDPWGITCIFMSIICAVLVKFTWVPRESSKQVVSLVT
jgi:hypothetical protein